MKRSLLILALFLPGFISGATLSRGEWFVNEDPGFGAATELSLAPNAESTTAAIVLPPALLSGLTPGVHLLGVRFQDSEHEWGQTIFRVFSVPTGTVSALSGGEWFVNEDPGFGAATELSLAPNAESTTAAIVLPPALLSGLTPGVHLLGVRFQDSEHEWGQTIFRVFSVPTGTVSSLSRGEWFVDTDPGYGAATEIPFLNESRSVSSTFTLNPAELLALEEGVHLVGVRFQNDSGEWGQTIVRLFTPGIVGTELARVEWRAFSNGALLDSGDFLNEGNLPIVTILERVVPAGLVAGEDVVLELRAVNQRGAYGQAVHLNVSVADFNQAFLTQNFSEAEQADPLISGSDADPDEDGYSNLIERAFGTDPRVNEGASALPSLAKTEVGALQFSFQTPAEPEFDALSGTFQLRGSTLRYRLMTSEDLSDWSAAVIDEDFSQPEGAIRNPDLSFQSVLKLLPGTKDEGFYRLEIIEEAAP